MSNNIRYVFDLESIVLNPTTNTIIVGEKEFPADENMLQLLNEIGSPGDYTIYSKHKLKKHFKFISILVKPICISFQGVDSYVEIPEKVLSELNYNSDFIVSDYTKGGFSGSSYCRPKDGVYKFYEMPIGRRDIITFKSLRLYKLLVLKGMRAVNKTFMVNYHHYSTDEAYRIEVNKLYASLSH